MEFHQLQYFLAVARTGNFSRAAEQCHVAQPSLSQQIQKLEEELGETLFVRRGRTSSLTPHGEALLPRAARILEEAEAARREVTETRGLERGTINFGALPTIAPYFLPTALAEFRRSYPGVTVLIQEDTTARLLDLATSFALDFAILATAENDERLDGRVLLSDALLLALPEDHRLVKKRGITAADIRGEPLIMMKEGHCLGDQTLDFCAQRDIRPSIGFRSAQIETIRELVRAGLGLALIPAMAAERDTDGRGIVYRAFSKPAPSRKIVAVWPKSRPPQGAAAEFLKLLGRAS